MSTEVVTFNASDELGTSLNDLAEFVRSVMEQADDKVQHYLSEMESDLLVANGAMRWDPALGSVDADAQIAPWL